MLLALPEDCRATQASDTCTTHFISSMAASSHGRQHPAQGAEIELRVGEIQFTTEEDLLEAFRGQCRGDEEGRGFLLSILASHDGEALQTILEYLPRKARSQRSALWLIPVRTKLMTTRARTIQQAARACVGEELYKGDLLKALETLWVCVYWGIVQYHS